MKAVKSKHVLTLDTIRSDWHDCIKCEIGKHIRNHVFWDLMPDTLKFNLAYGKPTVDFVFIGEGPGLQEDVNDLPFIGKAGKLLRKVINNSNIICTRCGGSGASEDLGLNDPCEYCFGYGRLRIALTNLLLCRPYAKNPLGSGNRPPAISEIINCSPRLIDTLKVLNPSVVVALGREAEIRLYFIREQLAMEGMEVHIEALKHPSYVVRAGGEGSIEYESYERSMNNMFRRYWEDLLPVMIGDRKF